MKRVGAEYCEVLYIRVKPVELEKFRHGARLDGERSLSEWVRQSLRKSARESAVEMLEEVA